MDESDLIHFGVKGMRWGVRKDGPEGSSKTPRTPEQITKRKENAKKVLIGTAAITAAAGAAFVAYKMQQEGPLTYDSPKVSAGKKVAEKIALQEPTAVVHASRGKNLGVRFLEKGGLPDALPEYERSPLSSDIQSKELFERFGDGKVAARFVDPEGRTDHSSRPISHEVIVPKSMSDSVKNLDDIRKVIWPLVKEQYDEFYQSSLERRYS
jgi:hypothetical protein